MFEETVVQPSLSVEVFGSKICRGGRVLVAFLFGYECGCGCDAVNLDVFDEGTTLGDIGACGQVKDLVHTFGHMSEHGFIMASDGSRNIHPPTIERLWDFRRSLLKSAL